MTIKAPKWKPDAVPSTRGWEFNGELLIACKHTPAQLEEYAAAQEGIVESKESGPQFLTETMPVKPVVAEEPKPKRKSKKKAEVITEEVKSDED